VARNRQRAKQRKTRAREQARAETGRAPAPQDARTEDPLTADHRPTTEPPEPIEEASVYAEVAKASEIPLHEPEPDDEPAGDDELEVGSVAVAGESPELAQRGGRVRAGAELPKGGNRFLNFLRACWAELQRVQWPDRRAVAQATGVVLGFVVIAGGYLGLMDALFSRVVNAII
jgi:preprotein translocase SecE subunit